MNLPLPKTVEYIISTLESAGYRADVVGGSVRDFLLGKTPSDYDITTDATPDMTKQVFSEERTIDTGIKHGTVGLYLDENVYEITTHRVDGEYKDSRHPESVSFTTDIKEDLARRDFTVNAMAYSPKHGITDPFGGREDLKCGIIRAVGDPSLRFSEDALRILRAIRFSAVLGFEIEENTSSAIREKAHLLKNVSAERIYVELKKTLMAKDAYRVINEYSDVLADVIGLQGGIKLPDKDRFDRADLFCRFASIFALSCDNPALEYERACIALRTETHLRTFGTRVLSSLSKYDLNSKVSLNHAVKDLTPHWAIALVGLEILLGADESHIWDITDIINSGCCYSISDLDINGHDIMALGISGRAVGKTLERLLDAVIDGECKNAKARLLDYVNCQLNNKK